MNGDRRVVTRRDFVKAGALASVGVIAVPSMVESAAMAAEQSTSRVVVIRDPKAVDSAGNPVSEILPQMLDQAVAELFQCKTPAEAWKRMVKPSDVVGVKSNFWKYLPTPPALEGAIRQRVVEAGVRPENVAVDDRGVLANPVFQKATALVNIRPLRTHHWSGLGTCLKNYIMFVPDPSSYHANACENLGALWELPSVKGKTRLNVLVMLTPLFHGAGPHHFNKEYTWPFAGIIVGTDPVAVDATGARIIQAKRAAYFKEDKPMSPPPGHIAAADAKFHIGHSRPEQITVVRLGVQG